MPTELLVRGSAKIPWSKRHPGMSGLSGWVWTVYKKGSAELSDYNLNIPLVTAPGLYQRQLNKLIPLKPIRWVSLFILIILPKKCSNRSNASGGTISFYSTDKPNNGKYCLAWSGSGQIWHCRFQFFTIRICPNWKLKIMHWVFGKRKCTGAKFHLRFTDTKTSTTDHPWRMNFAMDETTAQWDGKWHKVYLPLSR